MADISIFIWRYSNLNNYSFNKSMEVVLEKIFNIIVVSFFVMVFCNLGWGQQTLPFVDNFGYSTGDLVTVSGGLWTEPTTNTSVSVQVTSGNLSYTGYPASGIGNDIEISGGVSGREKVRVAFTEQSVNGDAVYVSFLVKLTDDNNLDAGGAYFASLTQASSGSGYRSKLFIRPGSTAGKFQLGFAKVSTEDWLPTDFDVGTTYLVVISYEFLSGSDRARLWVNPDLSGSIPVPDLEQTSGSDASGIGGLRFEQDSNTPNAEIDGVSISTSWDSGQLPVELSSFNAYSVGNFVTLKWQTATEVNNYGFDIERKQGTENWNKIGFVAGSGNSNSPKSYSYTDSPTGGTSFSYRLKQIDYDGNFEYYDAITVLLNGSDRAKLLQNNPNPFNPSTAIKFYIPNDSKVRIAIYDILGREVTTLLDEQKQAGYHIVYWNGNDKNGIAAASGIYLYRLTVGNYVKTKKMNLLK